MILGGDELSRTQKGNNNAYCQDNEINWYDWGLDERREDFLKFVKDVIAFRKNHSNFRRRRFLRGEIDENGIRDALWWHPEGREMGDGDWSDVSLHTFGVLLRGDCIHSRDRKGHELVDDTFLILVNGGRRKVEFALPQKPAGSPRAWELVGKFEIDDRESWFDPEEEVAVGPKEFHVLWAVF
jgi:glycogen operon protein